MSSFRDSSYGVLGSSSPISNSSFGRSDLFNPVKAAARRDAPSSQYNSYGGLNPMYPYGNAPHIVMSPALNQQEFGPVYNYIQDPSGQVHKKVMQPGIHSSEDLATAKEYAEQLKKNGIMSMPDVGPNLSAGSPTGYRKLTSGGENTVPLGGGSSGYGGGNTVSFGGGVSGYGGTPQPASTSGLSPAQSALAAQFETPERWQEDYLKWSSFYRNAAREALGIGGLEPTDPLAQKQQELMSNFAGAPGYSEEFDFDQLLEARDASLATQLQQREAQLGVEGGYSGVLDETRRTQDQLANIAQLQYQPKAWEQQQTLENQLSQTLSNYAQAEAQMGLGVRSAGMAI